MRDLVGHDLLLLPSVTAAVFDSEDRLLLIDHVSAGNWVLPGGALEPNERTDDACVREVLEETGLEVELDTIVGAYSGPEFEVHYANGDRVTYMMAVYTCRIVGGTLRLDGEEARNARFASKAACRDVMLAPWARVLLDDCFRVHAH